MSPRTCWTTGKIGRNSLNFDGINDYVSCADNANNPTLNIDNNLTIEAWIKPNLSAFSYNRIIASKVNGNTGYALEIKPDRHLVLRINGTEYPSTSTTALLIDNNWHHVAATFEEGKINLYINAENVGVHTPTFVPIIFNSTPLTIGGLTTSNYFKGIIDEFKLCANALNEEEIRLEWGQDHYGADSYGDYASVFPIGGGVGYSDIIDPLTNPNVRCVVYSNVQLLAELSKEYTPGSIIYINDNSVIDLTGQNNINIPYGVTLASGRGRNGSLGAKIITNSFPYPLFKIVENNIRITGLRILGPDMEIGDYNGPDHSIGISSTAESIIIDNCELAGWGSHAIWLYANYANPIPNNCFGYIHHNYIHHNRRQGNGYGVGIGSKNEIIQQLDYLKTNALIKANFFDNNWHDIACSGEPGASYEACYNYCGTHSSSWHHFDMHPCIITDTLGITIDTIAGDSLNIHHNTFTDKERYAINIRNISRYESKINNNWFYNGLNSSMCPIMVMIGDNVYPYPTLVENLNVKNNFYGTATLPPNTPSLPVSSPVTENYTPGSYPLTVNFNATNNNNIINYQWFFGDGNTAIGYNTESTNAGTSWTFNTPGKYNVSLMVRNNHGIPASSFIPITVYPTNTSQYYLSFWVKDGYRGNQTGYMKKQVLIDNTPIWGDGIEGDIAGDNGWQHIYWNVTNEVLNKNQITIKLRFKRVGPPPNATPPEEYYNWAYSFWDDVVLFGNEDINDGDFESIYTSENWKFETFPENNSAYIQRNSRSSDFRSGNRCLPIYYDWVSGSSIDTWAQYSQTIILTTKDDKTMGDVIIKEVNSNNAYLGNNIPNPFTNATLIPYQLPEKYTSAEIVIADISSRMIKKYVLNNGTNKIEISNADLMDNGIYFYSLIVDGKNIKTNKMVLMK